MTWDVETSDEFTAWYNGLDDDETDSVDAAIVLLEMSVPASAQPKPWRQPQASACAITA